MDFERMKQESSPGTNGAESAERAGELRYTQEEVDSSWHQERFRLNGKEVEIFGVAHVPETIERYGKELEDAVRRAALVVLELAPQATDVFSDRTTSLYVELRRNLGDDITAREAARQLREEPFFKFYSAVEEIAATHGKEVAVADPVSSAREGVVNVYSRTLLREREKEVDRLKSFVAGAGLLGVCVPELPTLLRQRGKDERTTAAPPAVEAEDEASKTRKKRGAVPPMPAGMGRRRFLQTLAGGAAAAALSSSAASILRMFGKGGRGVNPLGTALYDGNDYRDVTVAEGLTRITAHMRAAGPVVVIYGDNHRKPIRHYVESPIERTIKRKAYAPYKSVLSPRLRFFRHDAERGWQVTREEELS